MSLISAIIKLHNKLSQKSVFEVDDGITSCDEIRELCRKATAEGCVLLKMTVRYRSAIGNLHFSADVRSILFMSGTEAAAT